MNEFNSENGRVHLFNLDCMGYMAQFPDNYFELAIVLDGDYFAASIERFERETAQLDMFASA